jgi:hypothetical protein
MEAGLTPKQQNIDVHEPEKDKLTADDFKKLRAMKKTPAGKVHNCATHVEHAVLGKGTTVSEEHAEPDENGNIEWYTIQFEHSTQQVLTKDLTITMSEAHVHESTEEQVDEEEKKKIVSPFDWKNRPSELAKKPGETAGFDSKKISTGTVYSRKPVKESAQIAEAAGEDKAVSAIVAKHDSDSFHVKTVGHEHVYAGESGSPDAHVYHVHNTQTGKTHHIYMEHGGDAMSHREIKKQAGSHISDAATKAIHKDHKEEVGSGMNEAMSHQAKTTMKHIPNPSPALKKAAKDIKPGIAGIRDRFKMLDAGGVKREEVEINELSVNTLNRVHTAAVRDANDASRDGDEAKADKRYNLAGKASNKAELKNRAAGLKPSGQHAMESVEALDENDPLAARQQYAAKHGQGQVYKPTRPGDKKGMTSTYAYDIKRAGPKGKLPEEIEQKEYTFAEYLDAARAQYNDEDAVLVANEAFKNQDITLFADQSQSPEA